MPRTKGTTKNDSSKPTEQNEQKRRGRSPGQKVERKPSPIVELNKDYRIKMDEYNYVLQEKCTPKDNAETLDDVEKEDGWKTIGYYSPNDDGLILICKELVKIFTLKKLRKELIVTWERYLEILEKERDKVIKLFAPLGLTIVKK